MASNTAAHSKTALVLPEERIFVHNLCHELQWPIVYCWKALAIWIRVRPHVFRDVGGGKCHPPTVAGPLWRGVLRVCLELSVIYMGPQDFVDQLPLKQKGAPPSAMYKLLFNNKTMPDYKKRKMTPRCLLHIEILLKLLEGNIST